MSSDIDQIIEGTAVAAPATPSKIPMPQVSLLPTEIRSAARGRTTRIALAGAVVVALVAVMGATALATVGASDAQLRLDGANARTGVLSSQVGKFTDVQRLQKTLALGKAAAAVGASTEVDWTKQMADIERDMPDGYRVESITADSATPFEDYQQGNTPLELPRAATVQLVASTPTITDLPEWLRRLRTIPAYADATASVQDSETDGYSVALTVHLSPKAEVRLAKTKGGQP